MNMRVMSFFVLMVVLYVGTAMAAVDTPITNGLLVALDGSDVTSSGGTVSSWNDQSAFGGQEDFINGTVNKQPALLADYMMPNGKSYNVLDFNISSIDTLTLSADSNFETNTFTTIAVVRGNAMGDGVSGYFFMCGYHDISLGMWGIGDRSTANTWIAYSRNQIGDMKALNISVGAAATNRWHIITVTWDGVSGAVEGRSIDEAGELHRGSVTGATASPTNHQYSRIGATTYSSSGNYAFDGQIAEVLVYNKVISSDDIKSVERYLKRKYFINESKTPPVTNGLFVKLDGTDVTLSNGKVFRWKDQAELGGLTDFYNNTSTMRPELLTDVMMPKGRLHNILSFDGTDDYLRHGTDSNYNTNTFTSFIVVRGHTLSDSTSEALFWNAYSYINYPETTSADSAWGLSESSSNHGWTLFARSSTGSHKSVRQNNSVDDRWYIISLVWNGVTGAMDGRFLDALQNLETATASGANANPSGHIRSHIGTTSFSSPNLFFDGQMAEILVYNRVLSGSEVGSVETFLKHKYFIHQGTIILIE